MASITTTPPMTTLRALPALAMMTGIYLLSDQPKLPTIPTLSGEITSILGHFGAYFLLAALVWWALGVVDMDPRRRFLLAFGITVLYGVSDEWHQRFVPGRHPDALDVLTDAIGAATALLAIHLAHRSGRLRELLA